MRDESDPSLPARPSAFILPPSSFSFSGCGVTQAYESWALEASVQFWERFSAYIKKAGGGETPWFLRTHPLDEDRIKELKKMLPEAKREFRPAVK